MKAYLALCLLWFSGTAAQAQLGMNWRLRAPLPWGDDLTEAVAVGTKLIVVGKGSAVLTSVDNGTTWAVSRFDKLADFRSESSIAWNEVSGAGSKVMAATSSGVWTSETGDEWVKVATDLTDPKSLFHLLWADTKWAAIQSSFDSATKQTVFSLVTSVDGMHWTKLGTVPGTTVSMFVGVNELAWNGSSFVVCGYRYDSTSGDDSGFLGRTTDGVTWDSTLLTAAADAFDINDVVWTGTQFVAVGFGCSYTSPTGAVWTRRDTGFNDAAVAWNGTKLVAVDGNAIHSSVDGITWTDAATPPQNFNPISVTWTGTAFVSVGYGGTIHTSPDGLAWTQRAPAGPQADYSEVAVNPDGVFIASDFNGQAVRSADGTTWTQVTPGTNLVLNGVVWADTKFVGVAGSITSVSSADGSSWMSAEIFPGEAVEALAYSGGKLIAVGDDGTGIGIIHSSTDGGATWDNPSMPAFQRTLTAVARIGAQWVAVGEGATVLTSPTGAAWTKRAISLAVLDFHSITGNSSILVAAGAPSTSDYYTSSNGIAWTRRTFPSAVVNSVLWTGNQFVAVGEEGSALTSTDGINWNTRTTFTGKSLYALATDGAQLVAVGDNGAVIGSDVMPDVQFAILSQTVGESEGTALVQVTLSSAPVGLSTYR